MNNIKNTYSDMKAFSLDLMKNVYGLNENNVNYIFSIVEMKGEVVFLIEGRYRLPQNVYPLYFNTILDIDNFIGDKESLLKAHKNFKNRIDARISDLELVRGIIDIYEYIDRMDDDIKYLFEVLYTQYLNTPSKQLFDAEYMLNTEARQ